MSLFQKIPNIAQVVPIVLLVWTSNIFIDWNFRHINNDLHHFSTKYVFFFSTVVCGLILVVVGLRSGWLCSIFKDINFRVLILLKCFLFVQISFQSNFDQIATFLIVITISFCAFLGGGGVK